MIFVSTRPHPSSDTYFQKCQKTTLKIKYSNQGSQELRDP